MGALPKVFDEKDDTYAKERAERETLLTPQEYRNANENILNAHYTDPTIVDQVWGALQGLGFHGGDVLEPGSASGNFIGKAPDGTHMTGVEVDPVTAAISQALHPNAEIHNESFAKSPFRENVFDATIGNVPFGRYALLGQRHNKPGHSIHNHFILKSLALTKPGGVAAIITSAFTLDSQDRRRGRRSPSGVT